eukprot:TRINITY_DN7187_c0_g1_i1.p2 TRINITY_DN7187_c0_g1~~TRINITY_DN7187_c0_g1_i1.p2  ORF type:complete len:274 (+),score=71.70 TRINITY_DN7187_c0_g1_i1:99-824(+)
MARPLRLVILSDTHTKHGQIELPDGDVLLHAGDFTYFGGAEHWQSFNAWLGQLQGRYAARVVTCGNHEGHEGRGGPLRDLTAAQVSQRLPNATHVLIDGAAEVAVRQDVRPLRIYGAPWQPQWCGTGYHREDGDLRWPGLERGIDIAVTHSPPYGHGDASHGQGSHTLMRKIAAAAPLVHCFGHVHEGGGYQKQHERTLFVNAACCGGRTGYDLVRGPTVVDVDLEKGEARIVPPGAPPGK